MQEYYKILGLSQGATAEEIDAAYSELKNKYMKDRFLEGEAGNEAAKNLTKLENVNVPLLSAKACITIKSNGNTTNIAKKTPYGMHSCLLENARRKERLFSIVSPHALFVFFALIISLGLLF